MNKTLIIGAGAAGLLAAGYAAKNTQVTVLERNDRPARKLMITGKGRCNVTNATFEVDELLKNIPVNSKFLYSAFNQYQPGDVMGLFEDLGVSLKIERGNRVFPCSDKAVDVVDALVRFAQCSGAEIITARAEKLIIKDNKVIGVKTFDKREFFADNIIIATGGKSYPVTGSTGDGYALAMQAGHKIIKPQPSLVPLMSHEGWCPKLQGLSLKNVSIKVFDTEKKKDIYSDFGEMLFTHFGVTGPLILSASSHMKQMKPGKYEIYLDMKPALSVEQLDKRIQKDFALNANKDFQNSLSALLPAKMIPVVVKLSGISATKKVNQISKEERMKLVELLKSMKITINGFRPIEEAIITSGGVCVNEVDPKTMKSKIIDGLFFCGEVLDVDAYTGGFNLQIAFSTAFVAGSCVK